MCAGNLLFHDLFFVCYDLPTQNWFLAGIVYRFWRKLSFAMIFLSSGTCQEKQSSMNQSSPTIRVTYGDAWAFGVFAKFAASEISQTSVKLRNYFSIKEQLLLKINWFVSFVFPWLLKVIFKLQDPCAVKWLQKIGRTFSQSNAFFRKFWT